MLVVNGITVLFVHIICEGSHDELCHLHQQGCWLVFEVVIPACSAILPDTFARYIIP